MLMLTSHLGIGSWLRVSNFRSDGVKKMSALWTFLALWLPRLRSNCSTAWIRASR